MKTLHISEREAGAIIALEEGHFADVKSTDISLGKLTRTISAFANADGGELYIGIEDEPRAWRGFDRIEDFNGHIQAFEQLFPLGHGFEHAFLECDGLNGHILKIEIAKSHDVSRASDKISYL